MRLWRYHPNIAASALLLSLLPLLSLPVLQGLLAGGMARESPSENTRRESGLPCRHSRTRKKTRTRVCRLPAAHAAREAARRAGDHATQRAHVHHAAAARAALVKRVARGGTCGQQADALPGFRAPLAEQREDFAV